MLGCNLRRPLGGPRGGDASTTRFTNMTTNSTGSAGVVSDGAGADWSKGVFSDDFWPVLFVAAMAG